MKIYKNARFSVAVASVLAAVSLSACAVGAGPAVAPKVAAVPQVNVTLNEFKILTDRPQVPAGLVKFLVTNSGTITHEMVMEEMSSRDKPMDLDGTESEVADLGPGKTSAVTWNLSKPGTYRLSCYKTDNNIDHFALGMMTMITVTAK